MWHHHHSVSHPSYHLAHHMASWVINEFWMKSYSPWFIPVTIWFTIWHHESPLIIERNHICTESNLSPIWCTIWHYESSMIIVWIHVSMSRSCYLMVHHMASSVINFEWNHICNASSLSPSGSPYGITDYWMELELQWVVPIAICKWHRHTWSHLYWTRQSFFSPHTSLISCLRRSERLFRTLPA